MKRMEKGSLPAGHGSKSREDESLGFESSEGPSHGVESMEVEETAAADGAVADLLVEVLEGEGAIDGGGQFTLDLTVALEKVGRFALPNVEDVPLMLVRSAVLRGAQRIHVRVDAESLRVEHDGRPFREAALRRLFDALLGEEAGSAEAGLRELAVAVATARHMSLRSLVVESGGDEAGVRLRLRPGRPPVVENAPAGIHGIRVHWSRALGADVVDRQSAHAVGRLPEVQTILDRCRYCPVELWLQGKAVLREVDGGGLLGTVRILEPGLRAMMGYQPERGEGLTVRVVRDGVWIDTISIPTGRPGLLAVVESEALRTDMTGSRVVRDAAWDALALRMQETAPELQRQLALALASDVGRRGLRHRARAEVMLQRAVVEEVGDSDIANLEPESPLGALVAAPIWHRLDSNVSGWIATSTGALVDAMASATGVTVLMVRYGMALPRLHPRVQLIYPGTLVLALREDEVISWLKSRTQGEWSLLSFEEVEDLEPRYPPPLLQTREWGVFARRHAVLGLTILLSAVVIIGALGRDCFGR